MVYMTKQAFESSLHQSFDAVVCRDNSLWSRFSGAEAERAIHLCKKEKVGKHSPYTVHERSAQIR